MFQRVRAAIRYLVWVFRGPTDGEKMQRGLSSVFANDIQNAMRYEIEKKVTRPQARH